MLRRRIAIALSLGAVVFGTALVPVAPAGTASTLWSAEQSHAPPLASLSGVSCVSAKSCHAVGLIGRNTAVSKPFTESWDGTTWSVTPSSGPEGSWLFGVSCESAVWCQAVGWANDIGGALTERWNGHTWTQLSNPEQRLSFAELLGVSCVSRAFCAAVGSHYLSGSEFNQPLIEMWNGKAWSVVPSPRRGNAWSALFGVSCVSRTSCTAVGDSYVGSLTGPEHTLIERWNGKSWSIVPSPNPSPNDHQGLRAVSCVSAASCVAVGGWADGALIESWNGKVWSIVPTSRAGNAGLSGVSCVSPTSCQAVGSHLSTTLIETLRGHKWSVALSPDPARDGDSLTGVSCTPALSCKAVDGQFVLTYG